MKISEIKIGQFTPLMLFMEAIQEGRTDHEFEIGNIIADLEWVANERNQNED